MTTVRKQKSGDQLTVGDWLAPGELLDGAAEVLFAYAYPASADGSRDSDGKHVQLVMRKQGATVPYSDVVSGYTLFDLASDEDLAALREAAERAQRIADIRAFAGWLEANPWIPLPYHLNASEHFEAPRDVPDEAAGLAKVRELAARFGVKTDDSLDDRTTVTTKVGRFEYRLVAWHKGGRPADAGLVEETEVHCASSEPHAPHRTTFAPEMGIANGICPGRCTQVCIDMAVDGAPQNAHKGWHDDECPAVVDIADVR